MELSFFSSTDMELSSYMEQDERQMEGGTVDDTEIKVSMDRLYATVSMLPSYDKPENLFGNVVGIHNALIDNIRTRYGKWHNAWIIGGYQDKHKREKLADDLGAELIFCNVSREECLRRLDMDEDRKYRRTNGSDI